MNLSTTTTTSNKRCTYPKMEALGSEQLTRGERVPSLSQEESRITYAKMSHVVKRSLGRGNNPSFAKTLLYTGPLEGIPSPLLASPSSILTMYLSTCAIVSDLSVSLSQSSKTSLSDLALSFYLSIYLAGYSVVCLSVSLCHTT